MGWALAFFAGWLLRGGCANRAQRRFMDEAVAEGKKAVELARHLQAQKALEVLASRVTALERLNVLALLIQEAGLTVPPEVMRLHLDAVDDVERTDLPPLETLPPEVAAATRQLLVEVRVFRNGISEIYANATEPAARVH